MTLQELRDKSAADLQKMLTNERNTLRELSFKASEMQLSQVHKIKQTKQQIARILTVLGEANQSADA